MIFIYLRLPYRRQIRIADPETLAIVDAAIEHAVLELGGRAKWMEERIVLSFDEAAGCALLRASEALRSIGTRLAGIATGLHGYTLVLECCDDEAADVVERLDRVWLDLPIDGVWATDRASEAAGRLIGTEKGEFPLRSV
ncbi:MAG TPA: hypothetical protein VMV44_06130, partial [Rectinemataceae bacterium]|nr:hypothetical protein [Rectinemataceae bacterium]